MANYVCIRVVARPFIDKNEEYAKLCKVIQDSDEFIESIGGNPTHVWLDIDNFEPDYNDEELWFQLIAKYNYPRHELEEGLSNNYVVDYDIVFADEYETYEIDYLSNNPDILLSEVGCIGVYKKRRLSHAEPNDGFDCVEKYFFPQSEEEKHLMYLYAWAESYFSDVMDRQKLYHTDPENPENLFYDLRDEMDLKEFLGKYVLL